MFFVTFLYCYYCSYNCGSVELSRKWEAAVKKVFMEISQNSQKNTCARVSFLRKFSSEFCEISKNIFLYRTPQVPASVLFSLFFHLGWFGEKEDLPNILVSTSPDLVFPAGIYLFKVNSRNTRTRFEICSKSTIKTPEDASRCSGVFISYLVLAFLLLTLNM